MVLDEPDPSRGDSPGGWNQGLQSPVTGPQGPPTTRQEQRLRRWVMAWALISVPPLVSYVIEAFTGPDAARAYAVNSVAKEASWLILAVLVWSNVRRFTRLVSVVVVGHVAIIATLVLLLVTGHAGSSFPTLPESILPEDLRLAGWLLVCVAAAAALQWQQMRARRSVLGLRHFAPIQYETLAALSETVMERPLVPADDVALTVDHYWAGFPLRNRNRARAALTMLYVWPIFTLRAPFPLMDQRQRKRFVERRFRHRVPLVRTTLRFAVQMVYMGYYSNEDSHAETGFEPFSERRPHERRRERPGVTSLDPDLPRPLGLEAPIVIVGTGAAGSVMAHTLVSAGHDVLMLERGAHVPPETFTENELAQYAQLYRDGALQLSQDFRFQALQGMGVGGSTTVNNGVCFRLPPEALEDWRRRGAQIDATRLDGAFTAVERLIGVTRVPDLAIGEGARRVAAADPRFEPLRVNIEDCIGCGSCNIGCPYGRKLSMLDHVLPLAQRPGRGRGSLRILPLCEVERIDAPATLAGRRVRSLRGRVGAQRRPVEIRADTVIVAAGAIHSSRLLQRSGLGGPEVGRGLCANLGSFMTGDFRDRPPEGLAGLQQTHALAQAGYLLETWFNPVVSQSLVMPGWLDQHRRNMQRYDHMTCVGALVGTAPAKRNRVHRPSLLGSEFSLEPSDAELRRIVEALKHAGRILLDAEAQRVMPPTFTYREYRSVEELADLDSLLLDRDDLSLQTAHPQGGNALGTVVDETFRVQGLDNLYCCDASVFPAAITAPPQLTVMALAHLAATHPQGLGALPGTLPREVPAPIDTGSEAPASAA